jgi:hypothetical protein
MSELAFFDMPEVTELQLEKQKLAKENWEKLNTPKKTYANESALASQTDQCFDFEKMKTEMLDNLNWLKSLSVEEYTFRKKWEEMKEMKDKLTESGVIKARIWSPKDLNDESLTIKEIEELNPVMKVIVTPDEIEMWSTLRVCCHSAEHQQPPGRYIKFILVDDNTGKILGFSAIASDLPSISCRDEYIGWSKEDREKNKEEDGPILHSAVATTIASTQPLGYNFLGGKLVAIMMTSPVVRDAWTNKYNDVLVGMTTTSLYGPESMYNGIKKWWRGVGVSMGKMPIQPSFDIYKVWHDWLKQNNTDEYLKKMTQKEGVAGPVTSAKARVLSMISKTLRIKNSDYCHGFQRGVYYSTFYENAREFLCGKIPEDKLVMKLLVAEGNKAIIDWWKPKAIKRYQKLKLENRLNPDKLFYNVIGDMKYEDAKSKYFGAVGR